MAGMERVLRKVRESFVGREPLVFVAALAIVAGVWIFIELAENVREGDTQKMDMRLILMFRDGADQRKLVGPGWMQTVVRDVTALGGAVVMGGAIAVVAGFLVIVRRFHMMIMLLAATLGATLINTAIKYMVARARPPEGLRLTDVSSASFPSGHSAMSAAVYLTLGALLAQAVNKRRLKLYFLGIALLLTGAVGLSRVMLGVHYPSDVLAGWATGLVWALLCWVIARYLQRRGAIEKEAEALPESGPTAAASS